MSKTFVSFENPEERDITIKVLADLVSVIGKDAQLPSPQRDHLLDASRSLRRALKIDQKRAFT